mgnify:CR=1 FL=1
MDESHQPVAATDPPPAPRRPTLSELALGGALGAIAVGYGQSTLSEPFPTQWTYFQGALFIVVMLFLPGGIASLWKKASSLLPTRSPKEATADVTVPSPTEAVA